MGLLWFLSPALNRWSSVGSKGYVATLLVDHLLFCPVLDSVPYPPHNRGYVANRRTFGPPLIVPPGVKR